MAHFVWEKGLARTTYIVKRVPRKSFWTLYGLPTVFPPKWGRRVYREARSHRASGARLEGRLRRRVRRSVAGGRAVGQAGVTPRAKRTARRRPRPGVPPPFVPALAAPVAVALQPGRRWGGGAGWAVPGGAWPLASCRWGWEGGGRVARGGGRARVRDPDTPVDGGALAAAALSEGGALTLIPGRFGHTLIGQLVGLVFGHTVNRPVDGEPGGRGDRWWAIRGAEGGVRGLGVDVGLETACGLFRLF